MPDYMRRDRLRPLNLQICQFNVGLGDYLWTPWGGVLRRNPSQDEDTGDDYLQVLSESVLPVPTHGPKKKKKKNEKSKPIASGDDKKQTGRIKIMSRKYFPSQKHSTPLLAQKYLFSNLFYLY
jgi:hypothetical protein